MKQLTEQSLGIFWLVEEKDEKGNVIRSHKEVDGILIYGYWNKYFSDTLLFPYHLWPTETLVSDYLLWGDNWAVLEWTIHILEWPVSTLWENVLNETLDVMCKNGARVAWCGTEGHFIDPPFLFSPKYMSGSVYAALLCGSDFICSAKLGQPIKYLSDEQLIQLGDRLGSR